MASDPLVASTTRVADHREPAVVHDEDQRGIREHLRTFRDDPPKRVV